MQIKTACCEIKQRNPSCVIYLETGGEAVGKAVAAELDLPFIPLNIRYPLSRTMDEYPRLRPLLWLVKELCYKFSRPTLLPQNLPPIEKFIGQQGGQNAEPLMGSIVLADDRVSSFRTMTVAIAHLRKNNIEKDQIIIVTQKCSQKATSKIDYVISELEAQ